MLIIASKPIPLVTLVANPFTGNVEIMFGKESCDMFGPAYIPLVRQQLENALEVVSKLESQQGVCDR